MNYEPNTVDWNKGDVVIHDADAKEEYMLMVVIGIKKNDLIKTKYLHRETVVKFGGNPVYLNDKKYLHDPKIFGIKISTSTQKLKDSKEVKG